MSSLSTGRSLLCLRSSSSSHRHRRLIFQSSSSSLLSHSRFPSPSCSHSFALFSSSSFSSSLPISPPTSPSPSEPFYPEHKKRLQRINTPNAQLETTKTRREMRNKWRNLPSRPEETPPTENHEEVVNEHYEPTHIFKPNKLPKVRLTDDRRRRQVVASLEQKKRLTKFILSECPPELAEFRYVINAVSSGYSRVASTSRLKNVCFLTGRARGFYRIGRMSRLTLKEMINNGKFPGFTSSSW